MLHSARRSLTLRNALITVLILAAATVIGKIFDMVGLIEINIYTVFILGILVTAVVTASRVCSLFSSVFGILLFNYLFAEPLYSVEARNFGYPMDLFILMGVALLVSSLASNSARLSYRTRILLETDQLFIKATGADEIVLITAQQLIKLLDRPVIFHMAKNNQLTAPRCFGGSAPNSLDETAAQWTYKNGEPSGARTSRYARADYSYSVLRTDNRAYGVLGVHAGEKPLSELEDGLVQSLLTECALTLERDYFNHQRQEAALEVRNEKLRADLLRSISHDLRTPLTSISGSAGLLCDQSQNLSKEQKHHLYVDIRDDSLWLLSTVENLLSVTRIEDGKMVLRLKPEMMSEVVDESLRHAQRYAKGHSISTRQADDLLMARMDARLIMQVITNLVDNAIKYTPEGASIVVSTFARDGQAIVQVADDGPGIPPEAKEKVFDMFYTTSSGTSDGRRGLGLGLALCKAIVTAHAGSITVEDNAPHGTVMTVALQEERIDMHE